MNATTGDAVGTKTASKPRKLLLSAGLSWMFDAMDVGIISFIAAALAAEWSLTPEQTGFFTSINSVGMAFGAAVAGFMADKFGRKSVLLWTLLIFSAASGLSAAATGFAVLCVLRFIAGFGLGESCRWPPRSFPSPFPPKSGGGRWCCSKAFGRPAG